MKTIYVVTAYRCGEDKVIVGVYSSMERAQKEIEAAKVIKFGMEFYDSFEVKEVQLDSPSEIFF